MRFLTALALAAPAIAQTTQENMENCSVSFNSVLGQAQTNDQVALCAKDSGVPLDSQMPTMEDLPKLEASAVCSKWWGDTLLNVNAISPSCEFMVADGSILNTATFNWTLTELFVMVMRGVENANTSFPTPVPATSLPTTTSFVPSTPSTLKPGASSSNSPSPSSTPSTSTTLALPLSAIVVASIILT